MKTFTFKYLNGNAVISIESDCVENAWSELDELSKDVSLFKLVED